MRWARLVEEEWNFHSKLDHYLAQIAFLIDLIPARIWGDKKYQSKFEEFLVTFDVGGRKPDHDLRIRDVDRKLPPRKRRKKKSGKFADVPKEDLARYGTEFDPKDMTPDEKKACDEMKSFFFGALLLDKEGKPTQALQKDMARRKLMGMHKPETTRPTKRNNPLVRKDVKDGH